MKKLNVKLLQYIFAFALLVWLLTGAKTTAYAAYITVMGENQIDIDDSYDDPLNEGWRYNGDTRTLTLTNFHFDNNEGLVGIDADGFDEFHIVLVGDNRINVTGDYGICADVSGGDFTISGTGSLTVSSNVSAIKCKYSSQLCEMKIRDCTINATAKSDSATGIEANNIDLSIINSTTVTTAVTTAETSEGSEAYGIFTGSGNITINNADVTATAKSNDTYTDTDTYPCRGISGNNVTIENRSVVRADGDEDGIFANHLVTIKGKSTVNALGNIGFDTQTVDISSDVKSVIATGAIQAIYSKVKNAVVGIGWSEDDFEPIDVSDTARELPGYDKIQFPKPIPTITKIPTAKTLIYNGTDQELVTAGISSNGNMQYAIGSSQAVAPDAGAFKAEIPKGKDAGTYYVWYRVLGNGQYGISAPECVTVTIEQESEPPKPEEGNNEEKDVKLAISNILTGKKSITVKWNKQSEIDGYELQYAQDKKFKKNAKTVTINKAKTSATLKNLITDKKYFVRIRTYKKAGKSKSYSSWSEVKTVKTGAETIDKNLQSCRISSLKAAKGSVKITWSKQENITGYEIQCSPNKNFKKDIKKVTVSKATTTSKTIKKLKSVKYYVRIRTYEAAKGNKAYSKWSKVQNVKVK
ncbi:fibronectin type III domain-containing protein [Butyrivibrio sp. AE3006]|uniref:fibronectin type III domain-containing protein n=1 Tax=Butyrivibrio sp. AE3006 TaxID=1280673 RepID=UPI00040F6630|nr:fibronectin type III domain-containing protein [Butyrivibrio sp. AE3006]